MNQILKSIDNIVRDIKPFSEIVTSLAEIVMPKRLVRAGCGGYCTNVSCHTWCKNGKWWNRYYWTHTFGNCPFECLGNVCESNTGKSCNNLP